MTEENRFFRFVWRFNALAIALAVLAIIALTGFVLIRSFWPQGPVERPHGGFVPVSSAAQAANTYRLKSSGSVSFLKADGGEDLYLVYALGDWLGAPNAYGLAHVTSESSRVREPYNANLLLVNAETGDSKWLFKGFSRDIVDWDCIFEPPEKDVTVSGNSKSVIIAPGGFSIDRARVKALVLKVIDSDANRDGELTGKDGIALYVWRPGGKAPVKLLDADLIQTQSQTRQDRYVITYERAGAAWTAIYSAPDFTLLTKKALPKLPG